MQDKLDNIDLRSEEVQEILSKIPHWMIRWGNSLLLLLILLLLIISWLIKYPDIITSQVVVTTQMPLQEEYAKTTSKIDVILVNDNQEVSSNQAIAVIESTAKYEDVFFLKSIIDSVSIRKKDFIFPFNEMPILFLGEIEDDFYLFKKAYFEYTLNKQLTILQMAHDFENTNKYVSQIREAISNVDKASENKIINKIREENVLSMNLLQTYNQLKKSIRDWELRYVVQSKISGKVFFLNNLSKSQIVSEGELLFTVIPSKNTSLIAKLKVPAQNYGKVKNGQSVIVKLQDYPNVEFEILIREIKNMSLVPNIDGFYLIDVSLPDKLITSKNKEIFFKRELHGTADIITSDLRLIERIFYQN